MAIRRLSRGANGKKESDWKPPHEATPSEQAGDAASGSVEKQEWQPIQLIASLHQAKQELAQEMEANLKQLKAVLKETQRIAKDMEAVLQESKNGLGGGGGASGGSGGKQNGEWNPPGYVGDGAGQQQSKGEAHKDGQVSWGEADEQQPKEESQAEDLWSDPTGSTSGWNPPEFEKEPWQSPGGQ